MSWKKGWKVSARRHNGEWCLDVVGHAAPGERTIATVWGTGKWTKRNARLLSAAPELLSALRDALEELECVGSPSTELLQQCRTVIAKATGQKSQEEIDLGQEKTKTL